MKAVFGFFVRLFCCFAGAKLVLMVGGWDSRQNLLWLTGILLANVYVVMLLEKRNRWVWPRPWQGPWRWPEKWRWSKR